MVKFNFKKIVSLCLASSLALTMSACGRRIENELNEETYRVISIEEVAEALAESAIEKQENNEDIALAIGVDETAPAIVNIEKVEMEDGEVGYKYPIYYMPYMVDETKGFPAISSVLEMNDDYEIVSECVLVGIDGKSETKGFEGCVALYYPYYYALCLKNQDLSLFEVKKEEALETYGEDSFQYKVFCSVEDLPELAQSVYDENRALSLN